MATYTLWLVNGSGQYPIVQNRELDTAITALDLAVKRRQSGGWIVVARNAKRAVLRNGDQAVAFEITEES